MEGNIQRMDRIQRKKDVPIVDYYDLKNYLNDIKAKDSVNKHMHLVPDYPENKLAFYYHLEDSVLKYVMDNVTFRMNFRDERVSPDEVGSWFLTFGETMNVEAWLTCLKWERTKTHQSFSYYEDSGKGSLGDTGVTEEQIYLKYKTESGNEQQVAINSTATCDSHLMANFR